MRRFFFILSLLLTALPVSARAAEAGGSANYAAFTAGAQSQPGLFPIWRKGDRVYLELDASELDRDFLESITIASGLPNHAFWGDNDYLPAELVRFQRRGDQIIVLWPNWYAVAPGSPAAQLANESNFPDSVVGTGVIVATNGQKIIFDASSLLGDVMDLKNVIDEPLSPGEQYRLNSSLSYFEATKAFQQNDVITVSQTWSTEAKHMIDTAPDARQLRVKVAYNFTQLPQDDYRPRYADDRVGLYDDIYLDFAHPQRLTRKLDYLVRWNFDPEDPSRPSKARHPFVFTLSNTIPPRYRQAVSDGVLAWNDAFKRIGILDAVQVQQQPNDPNWDPDDIRYNVIRWITEPVPSFGADSQTLYDPRTGEEIRSGILLSAGVGMNPRINWRYMVDPVRYGRNTDPVPEKFMHDAIFATVLHETGHNMGMQHNFVGSLAYTAKELQDPSFTHRNGITSTAMEYSPLNLWPRPYAQGDFYQVALGPYDYYAIKWGYAAIPNAKTPDDELPTLRRWAQAWSDPRYRYASDEDVSWDNGHAADPRVETGDLTNDPLAWCGVQMQMYRDLIATLPTREPLAGHEYEEETTAFQRMLGSYLKCATLPAHWIGGQYISRAHRGDPHAAPPVVPVPLAEQRRALDMLANGLFNDGGLHVAPQLLAQLGYAEHAGYGYTSWEGYGNLPAWAYDPPERHDYPYVQRINTAQMQAVNFIFQPHVLQRLDENALESTGPTLGLAETFQRLRSAIYGNYRSSDTSVIRRNLQIAYAKRLHQLATSPAKGTPPDAQALAKAELDRIHAAAKAASTHAPESLRAHLQLLASM